MQNPPVEQLYFNHTTKIIYLLLFFKIIITMPQSSLEKSQMT